MRKKVTSNTQERLFTRSGFECLVWFDLPKSDVNHYFYFVAIIIHNDVAIQTYV